MYASKTVILFLAFLLAVATAHPLRHPHRRSVHKHRRSSCPRRSSTVASAAATGLNGAVQVASTGASATTDFPSSVNPSSTASAPEATSTGAPDSDDGDSQDPPQGGNSNTGAASALFPVPGFSKSWSTSPRADNPLPLSDGTLRPTRLMKALSHDYVDAPDGKLAMKAHYPKGSYTFGHQPQGGLSFYAPGPGSVDLTEAKEATFGYSVFFEQGFEFQKGGKLPGLCTYFVSPISHSFQVAQSLIYILTCRRWE